MAIALAFTAAYGTYLLVTAVGFGWRGVGVGPRTADGSRGRALARLAPARDHLAAAFVLFVVGAAVGFALFGGALPAVVAGGFASSFPAASRRARHERQRAAARDGWPRLIEEMRVQVGAVGRSVPNALFEVGRRAPAELRPAFAAAEREWLVSTDFDRTVAVLQERLADPTADATLETLLVAHAVGGTDVERRLAALAEDRAAELRGRKDAEAEQAGVRFARRFVLLVPLGMTLAGLSIGTGRDAYRTAAGQVAVAVGLAMVAVCWAWAGRLLRLPEEERVFVGRGAAR
jgi:tight adherence protein B